MALLDQIMSTSPSKNQQLLRERGAGWNHVSGWFNFWRMAHVNLFGMALFMLGFFALAFAQMPARADFALGDVAGPWKTM